MERLGQSCDGALDCSSAETVIAVDERAGCLQAKTEGKNTVRSALRALVVLEAPSLADAILNRYLAFCREEFGAPIAVTGPGSRPTLAGDGVKLVPWTGKLDADGFDAIVVLPDPGAEPRHLPTTSRAELYRLDGGEVHRPRV